MLKGTRRGKLLSILSFVIFSIPMGMIFIFPRLARLTVEQGGFIFISPFLMILNILIIVSPWAFLSMIIFFYNKQSKLKTYAATLLFLWAALTQVLYMLAYLKYLGSYPSYFNPYF